MADSNLTAERVRALFQCREDGKLVRLVKTSNTSTIGEVAGSMTAHGYIYIKVDYRGYMAHRLVFLYVTGRWPNGQIDHINGNRTDNRFENLREATQSQNSQNQKRAKRSNASSGLLGVTRMAKREKWMAQIMVDGKRREIGQFDTPELAHAAYIEIKRQLHPFGTL